MVKVSSQNQLFRKILSGILIAMAALLLILSGCGAHASPENCDPATIVTTSDIHYSGDYCDDLLDAFFESAEAQDPDCIIITGDLTYGDEKDDRALAEKLNRLEAEGIQVLVILGDDDSYENSSIYEEFGWKDALARDTGTRSYVAGISDHLWVLMLDVWSPKGYGYKMEEPELLEWVEAQLKAAEEKGITVIAAGHEGVLEHNPVFEYEDSRESMLSLYETYGVICNLSGHLHIQHIQKNENGFVDISQSSLTRDTVESQFGVIRIDENTMDYQVKPVKLQEWAEKNDRVKQCRSFQNITCGGFYSSVRAWGKEYTGDNDMLRYIEEASAAYFQGKMNSFAWKEDLLERWKRVSPDDWGPRLESYREAVEKDSRSCHIEWNRKQGSEATT